MTHLSRLTDPLSSYLAEDELKASGKWKGQKAYCLKLLKRCNYPPTSGELADHYGTDRYLFSRRLPDLEKEGLVERCSMRECESRGTMALTWKPIDKPKTRQSEMWEF
jgi:DNA-binding MarR family transcriptional regulator